ncbi:probable auxin efflux carrier component 9 isoform X2 [Oryza brachyantha]|uniref:probable auxin efflux carrier component 9 isoform X2 n=1 Tax=Oryza brachyantha TaxID=4533 RepID=UPI0007765C6D|nr:probable auxin efflux carrier component 9 isoform X2 [Oryza brachyantha]
MITGSEVYAVVEAMVPLYTAAALGYASVRWLKAFSNEQCAGINHFVALYAVPVLIFDMVSTNDIYKMNGRLVAADTLQKAVLLLGLMAWALWERSRRRAGAKGAAAPSPLQWVITCFSVASLPNTIIMGVPLLNGMYGPVSKELMKQIVVMQFCIWYNVVIFLYEYMAARRAAAAPAPALDGCAKISPSSPVKAAAAEKGAAPEANGAGNVAADRPQEVAVSIEITEMTASTARDGFPGETAAAAKEASDGADATVEEASAPAPSMKHVVWMAVKKLLQIPNTYASFLGLIWSLIAFKWGFTMPKIVEDSLFTIRTTAVGLSMFSSGTFIARQSRFVPCGYKIASFSMVIKFLIGPVVMLFASLVIGMHGTLLHIAVVQAALPLAVTSFVYAEEYKVQADIMSTGKTDTTSN